MRRRFKDGTYRCVLQIYAWCVFGAGRGLKRAGTYVEKLQIDIMLGA